MTEAQVRKIVREEIARWAHEQQKIKSQEESAEQLLHEQIMEEIYGPLGQG